MPSILALFSTIKYNIQLLTSIAVLLNNLFFKNENFATFTFVVTTCSTLNLRYLRTFIQVLATVIKIF